MKLDWIEIKNFRGIKRAKLENFADINIFIGKNNTGKSTVLEAIYLISSNFEIDWLFKPAFIRIIEKRGWLPGRFEDICNELKFRHLENPKIKIKENEEFEIRVFESVAHEWVEKISKAKSSFNKRYKCITFDILKITSKEWYCSQVVWLAENVLDAYVMYSEKFKEMFKEEFKKVILVDESFIRDLRHTANIFEKLIDIFGYKIKKDLLEGLRLYYPQIMDLDVKENVLRIIFEDFSITLPSIADGLKSCLIASMATYILEEGIICFEEPENHLHPALQNLYAEYIVNSVISRKNQIFISTHSLEFLEKLLKEAENKGVNVHVYKFLELKEGELKYSLYERDHALRAIAEIGVDLRR